MSDAVIMAVITAITTIALALISAMKPARSVTNHTARTAGPQTLRAAPPPPARLSTG